MSQRQRVSAALWPKIFLAIVAACAQHSIMAGTLSQDALIYALYAIPYLIVLLLLSAGQSSQRGGLLGIEACWVISCLTRALAALAAGQAWFGCRWPLGFVIAMQKGIDRFNEPLVLTVAEQTRLLPLMLCRAVFVVGLGYSNASQGLHNPWLRSVTTNLACVVVGGVMDLHRRSTFLRLLKQQQQQGHGGDNATKKE